MGRLRELLGEEEMRTCGGHWRENWVRKDPELLMRGIVDLTATLEEEEALRRGGHVVENPIQNRAAYLTTLLKDWKIKQAAAVAAQGKETKR